MKLKAKMIRYYRTPSSPPTSSYERELARKRLTASCRSRRSSRRMGRESTRELVKRVDDDLGPTCLPGMTD